MSRPLGVTFQCGFWAGAWEQYGVGGQDRKFFRGPETFELVIGTITAGWCCESEFKRNRPKALSFFPLCCKLGSTPGSGGPALILWKSRPVVVMLCKWLALSPAVSGDRSGVCTRDSRASPALTSGWGEGACAASCVCSEPSSAGARVFWRCEPFLALLREPAGGSAWDRAPCEASCQAAEVALGIANLELTPTVRRGAL